MKKVAFLSLALALTMGATGFVACGIGKAKEEKKVMNIVCNPSVEFVLDSKDKVVSVNALNEEGNLIVSAEAFVGLTAEDAAKLFVKVSTETGFLVAGSAEIAKNEISISLSGDAEAATKLYNDVTAKVNAYLSEEKVTATITQAAAITQEQLQKLVAECAPYLEEAEVKVLEYAELVETLYESRKETAEYYSQELKKAYYEAKTFVMEQAELEVLKSKVGTLAQAGIDIAYNTYAQAVEKVEDVRMAQLVDPDSSYQVALTEFRNKKIAYLNYREEVAAMESSLVTDAVKLALTAAESGVALAETALLNAGSTANAALDLAKTAAKTQYDVVVALIEGASVKVGDHLSEISEKQQTAKTQLFTTFEEHCLSAIAAAKKDWASMKAELEKTAEA